MSAPDVADIDRPCWEDCDGNGWVQCWVCSGAGGWHDCGEDCCACADPDMTVCPTCHGDGEVRCPGSLHDGAP